jgi:hypothetical protein
MARRRRSAPRPNDLATLTMFAPMVISTRLAGMWFNAFSPTAAGERENARMVSEKMAAVGESAMAMSAAMARQNAKAVGQMMTGAVPTALSDTQAITNAMLKPYATRVRANHTRLLSAKSK